MKKALIALAVLGLTGGAAVAQSSVTLFGVLDADMKYVKTGDLKQKKLDSSGLNTSRFGVRGTEDLGGGLKAGFWLESEVAVDTGVAGNGGAFWGRRATVSLAGDFGEVRLGRNKTVSRLHLEDFDPFTFTGLGSVGAIYSNLGSGNGTSYGRADNLASYSLPNGLGGFYGGVDVSAGEGVGTNKGQSVRLGYKDGPLHVSGTYASTSNAADNSNFKLASVGGAYDFGVARPSLSYTESKFLSRKQRIVTAAVTVPVGQGQFVASYTDAKANDSAKTAVAGYTPIGDAKLLALGYAYNLSKRTALYTTFSQIDNKGAAKFLVAGAPAATAGGQKSTGYDVGIRHSF
ncbi:porin [Roseateles sp.]|uniref:porin n=1 Tax=Roseateles sp. TaxID=1971397 RepID=UPI0025F2AD9A|nr:porin [Roseateles sp.]MBV8037324.1 porin [Roseateles sp.]